ncbi:hypothetical protein BDV59DRAFT_96504 [Aspergillus ambiguus]|uniref:uncharacterized protein n=1 Tax=Aspergillus ambiguus TaxID=176160 RepID=UPI003CCCDE2C
MSTPRASQQAWAVPATQNTAPVIKFRCLYTHDLRRKAKRWQDGYLRFHTFNKRVMVYDTPGNFIGDLHWRQDAPLEDGDELELDRGVLIQVCEPMETTKTDISAIYSHKKSQTSPSQTRDQPTPSLRPSTPVRSSISSQPSRSLNDLLGIKKTAPVGKLVSHYEEHNGTRSNQKDQHTVERAPKRQRVESSERPRQPDSPRSDHQPELIDLSNSTTTGGLSNGVTPVFEGNGNLARARAKSPRPRNVPPKTANTVEKNMDAVKTPSNPPAEPSRSTEPPISAAKPPQTSHSNPPTNSLRLSTSKPRKKLMYRELLPGQASARKPPPQSGR